MLILGIESAGAQVGWAGGGPGPDFFVYLGARPASWRKRWCHNSRFNSR